MSPCSKETDHKLAGLNRVNGGIRLIEHTMAAIAQYLTNLTAKYSPSPFPNRRDEYTGLRPFLCESASLVGSFPFHFTPASLISQNRVPFSAARPPIRIHEILHTEFACPVEEQSLGVPHSGTSGLCETDWFTEKDRGSV